MMNTQRSTLELQLLYHNVHGSFPRSGKSPPIINCFFTVLLPWLFCVGDYVPKFILDEISASWHVCYVKKSRVNKPIPDSVFETVNLLGSSVHWLINSQRSFANSHSHVKNATPFIGLICIFNAISRCNKWDSCMNKDYSNVAWRNVVKIFCFMGFVEQSIALGQLSERNRVCSE